MKKSYCLLMNVLCVSITFSFGQFDSGSDYNWGHGLSCHKHAVLLKVWQKYLYQFWRPNVCSSFLCPLQTEQSKQIVLPTASVRELEKKWSWRGHTDTWGAVKLWVWLAVAHIGLCEHFEELGPVSWEATHTWLARHTPSLLLLFGR